MNEFNKLNVTIETGQVVTINVIDIIDSLEFNKTFIIYTINGDEENLFASILNEKEESFSLDKIESNAELTFINGEIDRVVEELSTDGE